MMDQYRGTQLGELSPHVFAVAEAAFRAMSKEKASQSILVSGESGAGKTETAKQIMQYLAHMGGRCADADGGETGGDGDVEFDHARPVEQQVLESNPLLEAFGNAKTVRNDNSSRFGKFIEIQFDEHDRISGAAIRTYLLERSRIVNVDDPERNFHVFYQLLDGASDDERATLRLKTPADYHYTNQSSCATLDGVDNATEYAATRRAMDVVGIEKREQDAVMRVIAGILHLGNVDFKPIDGASDDGCELKDAASATALEDAAAVMMVDASRLEKALKTRTIATPDGAITKPLDVHAALNSRDSLAKTLYSRLFDWLVARINVSIGQDASSECFIGVLDIYGFESFKTNSFEQFCINLANEKLQQHFNQHVFKMEQEEYEREAIDWSYIEFVDNQDVLDLIEKKSNPPGIITMLDEACMFPTTTHEQLSQKLYAGLSDNPRFKKPKRSVTAFTLTHYAGEVTYDSDHFIEKNKDFVVAEHQSLLASSGMELLVGIFDVKADAALKAAGGGGRGKNAMKFSSIAAGFKTQLAELMAKLNQTSPHYIRCIKPNQLNKPMVFENANVLHQLRCGGVLEAVRISCAGYPSRKPVEEFLDRFGLLAKDKDALFKPGLEVDVIKSILADAGLSSWQMGKTKVFLRAGQMAVLDVIRHKALNDAAAFVQKFVRRGQKRKAFLATKAAANCVARWTRGMLARRLANHIRLTNAATRCQARARCAIAVRKFHALRSATVRIQAHARGAAQRARYSVHRQHVAATKIQAHVRMCAQREAYVRRKKASVTFQCAWRKKAAGRELRRRRHEQRETGALQKAKSELEKRLELERVKAELEHRRLMEMEAKREKEAAEHAAAMEEMRAAMEAAATAAAREARRVAEEQAALERVEAARAEAEATEAARVAEAAATSAALDALRASAEETARALETSKANAAAALAAEKENVETLAARLKASDEDNRALRERVMMLENENARLKQIAKENVMAMTSMKAADNMKTPTGPKTTLAAGAGVDGGLSPPTPDSVTGLTPPSAGTERDIERQQAELDAKRASLANARASAEHDVLLEVIDRASDVGFRRVLYTGPHTTALAWWTPFLKDVCRRLSPPRVPRFQSPSSTPFNSI